MTRLTVYEVLLGPMPVRSPKSRTARRTRLSAGGSSLGLPGVAVAEDDDVAAGHVVVEPVDEDAVADVQRVLHRLRRHAERLDDEGLHEGDGDEGEENLGEHREAAATRRRRPVRLGGVGSHGVTLVGRRDAVSIWSGPARSAILAAWSPSSSACSSASVSPSRWWPSWRSPRAAPGATCSTERGEEVVGSIRERQFRSARAGSGAPEAGSLDEAVSLRG